MQPMTPFVFLLTVLASWRLTSLIVEDTITAGFRIAVGRRFPPQRGRKRWQAELVHCGRCASPWVSAGVLAAAASGGAVASVGWWLLAWGACSGAVAFIFDVRR